MAGYKTFVAGEEATAADANSYLMSQTVPRFASAAARTAALSAPVVNQLSQLDANKGVGDYWDGTAWVPQAVTLERFYKAGTGALVSNGDTTIGTFTMPITASIIVDGIVRIEPGSAAGGSVVQCQCSASSIPAPADWSIGLGPLTPPNAYRCSIPIVGVWGTIASGTAITLKVNVSSSAGVGAEVAVASICGSIRLVTKGF
jgi:hypothetical protein